MHIVGGAVSQRNEQTFYKDLIPLSSRLREATAKFVGSGILSPPNEGRYAWPWIVIEEIGGGAIIAAGVREVDRDGLVAFMAEMMKEIHALPCAPLAMSQA